jgi:hypothetical protein
MQSHFREDNINHWERRKDFWDGFVQSKLHHVFFSCLWQVILYDFANTVRWLWRFRKKDRLAWVAILARFLSQLIPFVLPCIHQLIDFWMFSSWCKLFSWPILAISNYAAFLGWLIFAAQWKISNRGTVSIFIVHFSLLFGVLSDFEHISSIIRIIIVIIDSSEFELLIGLFAE